MILNKANKTIGLLCKLHNVLRRSALLTICKSFISSHLDYDGIIYDQAYNSSFHQKLKLLQCNGCLTITGAIRDTSREKLFEELGLESLQLRHWFRKPACFYKHFLLHCPMYITERRTLLSIIENSDNNLLDLCEPVWIRTLLFGSNSCDTDANTNVLNATIEYILSTKRFDEPLLQ